MRIIAAIAAVLLILAGQAVAATINVPADQATIQAAINAASTGDTILVAAGTYTDTNYLLFDAGETGKNITIEGVGTCTYASSNASFSVYLDTSIAAGTFTFRNMRIVPTVTQANVIRFRCTATSTATLVFDGCVIDSGAVNSNAIYGDSGTGSQRTLTLTNSTVTGGASAIDITSGLAMTITSSTLAYGAAAESYGIIPRGTWTTLKVSGGSVTGGSSARNGVVVSADLSQTMASVSLDGLNVTTAGVTGYHSVLLQGSSSGALNVRVTGCTITNSATVASTGGLFVGADAQATTPALGTVYIAGNTIGCAASHSALLGGNSKGPVFRANTIIGTGDFGLVVKAEDALVEGNKIYHPTPLYVKGGGRAKILHNTLVARPYATGTVTTSGVGNRTVTLTGGTWPVWVTSDAVIKIGASTYAITSRDSATQITLAADGPAATGSAYAINSTATVVRWVTDTDTCVGLTLVNNLIDGTSCNYVLHDLSGTAVESRSDYNLYYGGVAALAYVAGSARADLAALRAGWGGVLYPANDAGSVVGNPLVKAPATADFSVPGNSPAFAAASDGTAIGAWQANPRRQYGTVGGAGTHGPN